MDLPIRVLVVDDEATLRRFLVKELTSRGFAADAAGSAEEGLRKIAATVYDVVLLDMKMPGMDGLTALRAIRGESPAPEVLILTGQGSVETAVEAMRAGAFHYLTKPFHLAELEVQIQKAREQNALVRRASAFERLMASWDAELVGSSPVLARVRELIRKVAPGGTSVVVEGESGTGKELIARAIHAASARAQAPFVVVNCGALQESLLESEIFGHEKGSFTGALRTREGLAEAAHTGTLFLDEVAEMSLAIQTKFLRFLESGEVRRVGSNRTQHVDVRVVAATNRELASEVAAGRFREDLYYRLRVFSIVAPPLRDRLSDVPGLVAHFLATIRGLARGASAPQYAVTAEAMRAMQGHAWPGNIRELRNAVERMMILAEDGRITLACLPPEVGRTVSPEHLPADELRLDVVERTLILRALRECGGSKPEAAERLGISLRTLYNKLHSYRADPSAPDA